MSLETIAPQFGVGGSFAAGRGSGKLRNILAELQGLSFTIVAGDSADTDITLTGVATTDTIAFVLGLDPDNATPADQVVDFTANTSITDADTIQTDADSTGYDLVVVWFDKE